MSNPSFLQFMQNKNQLDEAFNTAPYELTMGKKNAGDVFFTFIDEDEKEFRIQFYTPQGLGKNVRQVFIGQKRGSTYPDMIARFKNPMRVIASMIEATKQYLATPLGKTIDGFAVNFSKKALERGMTIIPKIIRQSGLKQKLNVMDLSYAPVPDRGYVWLVKKGKDPAQVFDGPKMQGITWDDPDKVGDVPVQNNAPAGVIGAGEGMTTKVSVGTGTTTGAGIDSMGTVINILSNNTTPVISFQSEDIARLIRDGGFTANVSVRQGRGSYTGSTVDWTKRGTTFGNEFRVKDSDGGVIADITILKATATATAPADSNTTVGATSIEQLIDSGFVARVLGIIDTNIDQKASYLPGESIKKVGQARYQTKGGLVIIVNFDSVDGKNLKYSVFSEIETQPGVISGDARRVANEIMETITHVAEHQYKGEWEIIAVPMSAPYPIKAIRHSQGWGYVETANWTLKVCDALLERVKPGNTALLELNNEPLRGKHLLEIIPEKGDKTLMLKDRSGKIYGSIDLDAKGANAVNSKTLKMPRNASVFGETVNGMSIQWTNINFPKTGKYAGATLNTNVTYYYDKGKVAITPMVVQNGRTLNNPKTYELPLTKEFVQDTLDSWSQTVEMVNRNLQILNSTNYNPEQVFLDDIFIDDSGSVKWRGFDMGDRRTTDIMLTVISKETERLESQAGDAPGPIDYKRWENFKTGFASVPGIRVKESTNRAAIGAIPLKNGYFLDVVLSRRDDNVEGMLNVVNARGGHPAGWDRKDTFFKFNTVAEMQQVIASSVQKAETRFAAPTDADKKSTEAMKAYGESILQSAPSARDLDWQTYPTNNGRSINVSWDITFRRNTRVGAMRDYKAQVDRANQYLQSVYDDAKSKGYNPNKPDFMTIDDARESDEIAERNEGSAYSEYEQAIGGSLLINL